MLAQPVEHQPTVLWEINQVKKSKLTEKQVFSPSLYTVLLGGLYHAVYLMKL